MLTRLTGRRYTPEPLWADKTESVVLRALQAAQAGQSSADRRKWRQLHDFLRGVHYEHTHEAASVIYPDRSREWGQSGGAGYRYFSLISTYCDRLGVAMATRRPELELYDSQTGETLPDTHPEALQWAQDLRDARADTVLPTLERWVTAMGQSVISPTWTGDRIRWCLTPPYGVRVWQSMTDPSEFSEAQAISFELPQPVDSLGMTQPSVWSTWTREPGPDGLVWRHYVHGAAGDLHQNTLFGEGNVNGYGTYPHVLVQTEDPAPGELWIPPREPWIRQQIGINLALTDMWHGARYQIHPVSIITGAMGEFEETPTVGPGTSLALPEGASLTFQSPSLNLDEYRALIDHDLTTAGIAESIDPSTYTTQGAYQSIAGLQLRRHDLQIRREKVIPYYRRAIEEQLWEAHRAVSNYWAQRGSKRALYSPTTALRATFRPLPQVYDRQADALATQAEIESGITSVVERVMDREGISRAEAERKVSERLASRPPASDP